MIINRMLAVPTISLEVDSNLSSAKKSVINLDLVKTLLKKRITKNKKKEDLMAENQS